ncbi:hypothetical protein KBD49_05320 [Myxococcota bacterium]|nr:hypothetical protein [Myxococcota bacterium]
MKTRMLAVALGIGCLAASCGNAAPDVDGERPGAFRISTGVLVKDTIDAGGDPVDWKDFSHFQAGRATVTISIGDPYKPHGVQGDLTLFDFAGNTLQSRQVVPGQRDYAFTFDIVAEQHYFFRIAARKGRAGYLVEARVDPLDPCAACGPGSTCCPPAGCCAPGQVCRGGACVSLECRPRCDRGRVCEDGRCVEACPGGCRSGTVCDEESRQCVRVSRQAPPPRTDPRPACPRRCPAGQQCNESTGRCEAKEAPPQGIRARVLSVIEQDSGTVILLNVGSEDGVRANSTGRIGGVTFRVRKVSATRCEAVVPGSAASVPKDGIAIIEP